ncbi:cobalt/nickel transport system ATP-binding protein [Thermodesulfobium acidiphilum]|uniref:Cobalt/nickel transport system ATP-binding protein n=1 Tax=Thermodesulfobium acidiphilum TaxID=1794699 RepID=A0A2R4W081_THEAF|nr:ABC transporter ATP-binding protein [Thermodesulfobium acidiphilum]AWB10162.1 cobalt/nickel transport system ATP-binding protein [Thermodesulfobium acidiphilum]
MSGNNIIFKLKDVSFRYPSNEEALSKINLEIKEGDLSILLGANGCGKSTLLKILDALIFPQEGEFYAFGKLITEETLSNEDFFYSFRKKIGFLFQDSDVQLFNPTVWDEVAYGPLQLGLDKVTVKDRVEKTLESLELKHLKDRPPFRLSGGEKKKEAIASILSIGPEVLLLDEPTNGLDPRTQRHLINFIKDFHKQNKTIVISTHNLDLVYELASKVYVFSEDHKIIASGTPEEIMENKELLIKVNLIDEHFHKHVHTDDHMHFHSHE